MKLNARELLGSPRLSSATPDPAGKLGLFSASTYSFEKHESQKSFHVVDLTVANGKVTKLWDDKAITEAVWLGLDDWLGFLKTKDSKSEFWVAKASQTPAGTDARYVHTFAGVVSNLKVRAVGPSIHFVVSAPALKDGAMYSDDGAPKKHSSGRVYTSLFVRHWDEWISEYKSNLFSGIIAPTTNNEFELVGSLHNILAGTELESPIGPFGGAGDFDISPDGRHVIFLSKDPEQNLAQNTASYVYAVPFDGSSKPKAINPKYGASSSPRFSPDGGKVVYLQMKENGYEADKNSVFVTNFTGNYEFVVSEVASHWDRSPGAVSWSANNNYLYLIAEDHGREKVWTFPIVSATSSVKPTPITDKFSASELYVIADSEVLLVSASSITSPTFFYLLSTTTGKVEQNLMSPLMTLSGVETAPLEPGTWHGLSRSQISDFYYPGVDGWKVHAWMIKPSFFQEDKKYPLLFLIHGGPQGSWADAWSYRWNPAVMAEQGYVVVAFNPTGSTGYGKEFTDRIQDEWGGRPYNDLVMGFEYLEKNFEFIDTKNAIAAGASYGGYMINWIAGQPFAEKFKTLVCHDGIFNTLNMYATEELWFIDHDFKGQIFDHRHHFERWNPLGHVKNWTTPMLVIHSSKDYRIPISEALAAFNILQIKGIKSKLLTFPDENHWVLKPENSLVWHREVFGWMKEFSGVGGFVGGEAEKGEASAEAPGIVSHGGDGRKAQDVLRDD
ncbi:putative dipeptidyl-peptidase 5, variant 2 [Orbilia ellipsospora]|uniref:Dipeptidyl-peptidase V n=1 Tax=Orbilia ellipsospora TaxID=2528407 RepID=A0AAV9WRR8_9PEZI